MSEVAHDLGSEDPRVTIDHFVKLYINHRPVFGLEQAALTEAFDALGALAGTNLLRSDKLVQVRSVLRWQPSDLGSCCRQQGSRSAQETLTRSCAR